MNLRFLHDMTLLLAWYIVILDGLSRPNVNPLVVFSQITAYLFNTEHEHDGKSSNENPTFLLQVVKHKKNLVTCEKNIDNDWILTL